ncbi:MAG: RNA-protein complex protein Nop10 [Euryarchaeota archaeon]|nr:RNA-protein complex protein Nop10 [Euryarchaeota archaeon]MDE1835939.1 RNA-protein complex protein Nop10 [Euryarchaeota archaeon]MDE1880611.1 RNA-protein complex protein Nop10 [Euryarchaeota archaeon]MDE2044383.1 RNA-protein complex protein Nop10 [Thermoplasmata archaeon]
MTNAELRRCRACHRYTFQETCPQCKATTGNPHPARWSPEDRYARYRRALLAEVAARAVSPEPGGTVEGSPPSEQH